MSKYELNERDPFNNEAFIQYVCEKIGSQWKEVGLNLGLKKDVLDAIEKDETKDVMKAVKMLKELIQQKQNLTLDQLYTALKEIPGEVMKTYRKDEEESVSNEEDIETSNEKYIFKSNPCGICVIISNNFSNTKIERKGTKIDLDRLDKTFSKLNFKVIKKEDKTDKEIYQIIEKYGKKKVDCFVCCILSHGDEEKVFGNDNSPLTFNEMRSAISKNQENLLKGKPKIFFIQACQGPNAANQYVESDSINQYVESDLREELNLTENEDFYFSVCTTPGHISYRYSHYGTIYIQTLCDLLISNVSMQLVDILTKLNFEMRRQMITHPSLISLRNPTGLAINISNTVFNTLDKGVFFEIKK